MKWSHIVSTFAIVLVSLFVVNRVTVLKNLVG